MEALHNLVKAGKVRALGASAMYGYQFYNMQLAARDNGWTPFSAMENHYNLLYREDERELLPICKQMKVSLMLYSPLAARAFDIKLTAEELAYLEEPYVPHDIHSQKYRGSASLY